MNPVLVRALLVLTLMMQAPETPRFDSNRAWEHLRRLVTLGALLVLATTIVLIGPLHRWLLGLFATVEVLMRHHPSTGMLAFVGLAALSAMLAFLSSTILMPAAIQVWGPAMSAGESPAVAT